MRKTFGVIATWTLLALACTHQRTVTPNYSVQAFASISRGGICPHGEVISVSATNQSPEANSAGTTHAGIHTFEYRFDSDPSSVLQRGLEAALRQGGCQLGPSPAASLVVALLTMEARGLSCGFATCTGEGKSNVSVTVSDGTGRRLLWKKITSHATRSCGMTICNDSEASDIAAEVLNATIAQTIAAISGTLAHQLSGPPPPVNAGVPQT